MTAPSTVSEEKNPKPLSGSTSLDLLRGFCWWGPGGGFSQLFLSAWKALLHSLPVTPPLSRRDQAREVFRMDSAQSSGGSLRKLQNNLHGVPWMVSGLRVPVSSSVMPD